MAGIPLAWFDGHYMHFVFDIAARDRENAHAHTFIMFLAEGYLRHLFVGEQTTSKTGTALGHLGI